MNIYIDESGTFVSTPEIGKWNAVAALAIPEASRKKLDILVRQLRQQNAPPLSEEVKLNSISEDNYFRFLSTLEKLNAVVFCTATDQDSTPLSGLPNINSIKSAKYSNTSTK